MNEKKWRVKVEPERIQHSYIDRLFSAFQISNRHIQQEMTVALKEMNLTAPQFFILYILSTSKGTKSTELAEKLEVKPSAITVMIDRLLKNDFVSRQRDEKDRRIVKLELTSLGQDVFEKAKAKRREIFSRYLAYLDEEDVNQLVMIYEKLAAAVENNTEE
ncbi:MarR family winged helix-turn-helix transcriptional regulator [Rossellomorea arthrocnemi]|jgi:MarR family transcriptional regulator, organic hydroperoxide resistance regulator|uniref:MarR family winged helix-turn-helix transcriptional regulator n=1 Tax=Rossellomorea arthrocnemi TaxID=2769542 RepID=UPI00191885A6|nr:MarR family transcriptional regulator [Rossellomorea arthrocnemi]